MSMYLRTACLSLVLSWAMPALSMGQSSALHPHEPASTTTSYGSYILAVDAAVVATAMTLDSEHVLIGGYLLNGPVFHLAHGRPGQAYLSLLLRAALPTLGMLAGGTIGGNEGGNFGPTGAEAIGIGIGGMLGIIAASTIDGLLLARYTVGEGADERRGIIEVGGVSASPTVTRTATGSWRYGVTGTF